MNNPVKYYELCILIPCYNNLSGLIRSVESIFYDKGKYLIVIVDDGSTEKISEELIIKKEATAHPVHLLRLTENKGITVALNTGLQWIISSVRCDYIARLDCGDTCHPQRFYKQTEYLRSNTDVILLGSWCYFQNPEKSITLKHKTPCDHRSIAKTLYFTNVFIHPTIVIRSEILNKIGLYPETYPHAEDYAWFWMIADYGKTAILPLYLVVCELNMKGISYTNRIQQLQSRMAIIKKFGHKFALKKLAIIKTWLLMKIPYSIILNIKRLIS
ncbi:MAG: glycosyltransferase [Bacteroidetes bacterium]|nr:glycosyltransferase [Bacteroidota bacterium]